MTLDKLYVAPYEIACAEKELKDVMQYNMVKSTNNFSQRLLFYNVMRKAHIISNSIIGISTTLTCSVSHLSFYL